MHNPHYLAVSRHNIFYFRFPIPPALHPLGKASEIRLSLGTREPKEALHIARGLAYLGSVLINSESVLSMDFEDIYELMGEHFRAEREKVNLVRMNLELRRKFRDRPFLTQRRQRNFRLKRCVVFLSCFRHVLPLP